MTPDEAARHLRLSISITDTELQSAIDILCGRIEELETALLLYAPHWQLTYYFPQLKLDHE